MSVNSLLRDGWVAQSQVAKADAEAWAIINKVAGRHVGRPAVGGGGGGGGGQGNSAVLDSIVEAGRATGFISDRDVARAEAEAAAVLPSNRVDDD